MKKSEFADHVAYRWYFYVIWAVLAVFIWSVVVPFANSPKQRERVDLFVVGDCDTALVQVLNSDQNKPSFLRVVNMETVMPNNMLYNTVFSAQASTVDIIIVPEDKIADSNVGKYFADITQILDAGNFVGLDYYVVRGVTYGIKVFDKDTATGVATDYYNYVLFPNNLQNYYLFFSKNSKHIDVTATEHDDGAIQVAKVFLSL